ncbi:MAG: hypothetical protein J5983_03735 [Ruminococcus sp.]|nr:hypothetical protein [Ruminococcus sp.]
MNDAYYEHFVAQKPKFQNTLKRALLIIAVLLISYIGAAFLGSLALMLGFVALILIVQFVFPYFKVEYEYALLNHYLEISAIFNKEKRKKKAEIDIQKAEIIAPTGSHRLDSYRPAKVLDFSSGDKNAKTYSILTSSQDKLFSIIVEPDERMLNQMRSWTGSKMFLD